MKLQLVAIITTSMIAFTSQASDLFNYTQDQYVKIRAFERCVNKAGWDNDQEINDQIIALLLQGDGIPYDFEKVQRDEHWYRNKIQSSVRVEMEYDIVAAEKRCAQTHDIAELTARVQPDENSVTVSMDELLDL